MKQYCIKIFTEDDFPLYIETQKYDKHLEYEHKHDCNEIIFIINGNGVEKINDNISPVIVGDLYIINEIDTHSFNSYKGLSFYNLILNPGLFFSKT